MDAELDRMQTEGIIYPVDTNMWATPGTPDCHLVPHQAKQSASSQWHDRSCNA